MCEIWKERKSDNYFKQRQENKNSSAGAGLRWGYLIHRMRSSKMGILKFLGCCGVRHSSRWVRSFAKMAGLHFGVCQAQKDRRSDSLTEVSDEQANNTASREVSVQGLLVVHC